MVTPYTSAELLFEMVSLDTDIHGTFQPLVSGITYSATFRCRDAAGNESETVTVGPFRIDDGGV